MAINGDTETEPTSARPPAAWVFSLIAGVFDESMDRARRTIAVHPNWADVRSCEQSGTTLLAQSITAFDPLRPWVRSRIGAKSDCEAAKLLNVGERSVEQAKAVQRDATLERGHVSVSTAADIATKTQDEQRKIIAQGEKEILQAAKAIRTERSMLI
jgi:hypothetical protein